MGPAYRGAVTTTDLESDLAGVQAGRPFPRSVEMTWGDPDIAGGEMS